MNRIIKISCFIFVICVVSTMPFAYNQTYAQQMNTEFLLTANDQHTINVHFSRGDGTFDPPVPVGNDLGMNYGEFAIADFSGGGSLDFIASTDENPAKLYLFIRTGPTSFTQTFLTTLDVDPKDPPAPDYGMGLIAADLNNDGNMDFLENINVPFEMSYGPIPYRYWIAKGNAYLNNGSGNFSKLPNAFDFSSIFTGWVPNMSSTVADVNGDDYPDMLASEQSSGSSVSSKVYLLKGNGDGSFQSPVHVFTTNRHPASFMTLGDFNNDGNVDAIIGQDDNGDPGAAFLFAGHGDGTFDQTGIEAYDTRPDIESGSDRRGHGRFQAYDADCDDTLDIISASALSGPGPGNADLLFFRGQGDGTFDDSQVITPNILTPTAFVAPVPSCASCTYDVDVSFDPAGRTQIPGINPYATTGARMDGMAVIADFSDGSSEALLWRDLPGFDSGGVSGDLWSLTQSGDTFGDIWTLRRNARKPDRELTRIWIDALTGGSVFDTGSVGELGIEYDISLIDEFGTNGSALGWTFDVQSAPCVDIEVTYSDMVALSGYDPVGDIYRYLEIEFTNPGGLGAMDTLTFIADTDKVVPEPSTLLLLGSGLIGVFAFLRKRSKR